MGSQKQYFITSVIVAILVMGGLRHMQSTGDILSGFSESQTLHMAGMQVAITGFCMSGALDELENLEDNKSGQNFTDNGDINNEAYTKQSIYALLYSLYASVGEVEWKGKKFEFTHNTWGLGGDIPTAYPEDDPERHGRAAYAGLVNFQKVKDYIKNTNTHPNILEIGCGTGAGASLITKDLIPTANYTALDMQAAAIKTCNRLHAVDNPNLTCVHGNGKQLPFADESMDIVVISETHITDIDLDAESKAILIELRRVLKPGGLFVWGNALTTSVWQDAIDYLPTIGLPLLETLNVTQEAVDARVEDTDRVNVYCDAVFDKFPILKWYPRCRHTMDRLLKNFYRHPGTALFDRMVTGYDSYMHLCAEKV